MNKIHEKELIERIKLLRIKHSGKRGRSNFAKALGISPSTYSYYEKDRIPPVEILVRMSEITDISLEWLLTGKKDTKKLTGGLDNSLLRRIESVLDEYPELQGAILAFVDLLVEKQGLTKAVSKLMEAKGKDPKWIPVLGRTAAGIVHFWEDGLIPASGEAVTELDELVKKQVGRPIAGKCGAEICMEANVSSCSSIKSSRADLIQLADAEDGVVEFIESEDVRRLFPDSFALRIDGDSMSPRINDGDFVVLSPSVPAKQGQVGVVKVKGQIGVTCKIIRREENKIYLIPANEHYDSKVVKEDEVVWALAVLCHICI